MKYSLFFVGVLSACLVACSAPPPNTSTFTANGDDAAARAVGSIPPRQEGSAPPANRLTEAELRLGAVHIDVPANQWRILRLHWPDLDFNGEPVPIGIATDPGPGAQPWIGSGSQPFVTATGEHRENAEFSIIGLPDEGVDGRYIAYQLISQPPGGVFWEVIFIFGSTGGPTRFHLGVADLPELESNLLNSLPDGISFSGGFPELLEELQPRPGVAVGLEAGQGGFGGAYVRARADNTDLVEWHVGPIKVQDDTLADAGYGLQALRQFETVVDLDLPEPGLLFCDILSRPQAEVSQWSYAVDTPDFSRSYTSAVVGVSETGYAAGGPIYGPPFDSDEYRGTYYYGWAEYTLMTPTSPGRLRFTFNHNMLVARDGGGVEGEGEELSARVFSGTGVLVGYLNADLEALYGWRIKMLERNI